IAAAVRTKRPAPMMAPMPRVTSENGPSVRFSDDSPVDATSAMSRSIDLVRDNAPATMYPLSRFWPAVKTRRLYAGAVGTREPFDISPHPRLRVARADEVADDGHTCGARVDHRLRILQRHAADGDDGQSPAQGAPRRIPDH